MSNILPWYHFGIILVTDLRIGSAWCSLLSIDREAFVLIRLMNCVLQMKCVADELCVAGVLHKRVHLLLLGFVASKLSSALF